jgi:hypothetical protein
MSTIQCSWFSIDQGSTSRARPYGMSGAVVRWAVLDKPPCRPRG